MPTLARGPAVLLVLALGAAMVGCTSTTVERGGVVVARRSFLSSQSIGEIQVTSGSDGTVNFSLRGYKHDQTETVPAAVGTGIAAFMKSRGL